MRVVSVPGRHVRHPVTRRVIDERGSLYDPLDVNIAQLLAHGDLELAEDLPVEIDEPAPGPDDASSAPPAETPEQE